MSAVAKKREGFIERFMELVALTDPGPKVRARTWRRPTQAELLKMGPYKRRMALAGMFRSEVEA